jgi:hypothetical protein
MIDKDKKLVEDYIRVVLSEEGVLGKHVWPSAVGPSMPNEEDTVIEEMLYKELHNHFSGIAPLSEEAVTLIKDILESGEYSDTFVRYNVGSVVRGMRLPLSWLEENAPESLEDLPFESKDPMDWGKPVDIKPMAYVSKGKFGGVSSWTSKWDEARNFTTQWSPNTIPVILHSECSSGYFMSSLSFKRFKGGRYEKEFGIKKLNPNAHEFEILLFGDCIVTAVEVNLTQSNLENIRLKAKE